MCQNRFIGSLGIGVSHTARPPGTQTEAGAFPLAVENNFFFLAAAQQMVAAY